MTRPARVAMVTPHYRPSVGGIETHVEELSRSLVERGVDVDVITHDLTARLPAMEVHDGITVRRFPVGVRADGWQVSPSLGRWMMQHGSDYDVVHAHQYHNPAAVFAARAPVRRFVYTPHYHGTGHTIPRALLHVGYRPIGATAVRRADAVIAVSEAEASLLRRHFRSARGKISVIPGGIDAAPVLEARPFAATRPVVLSAGRIEPYKQVHRVVDAMARLDGSAQLVVVGAGSAGTSLAQRVRDQRLDADVRFEGRVSDDDMHRWARTAAVYVTMSRHEAMGMLLAQLAAAGVPCVASDIPAHRELAMRAPRTIRLVPVDSTPALLAQEIRAALSVESVAPLPVLSWHDVAERVLPLYSIPLGADT